MKDFMKELAVAMSNKTGLSIGEDHIHLASRRYYYIPETVENKPLFLHHYRGPFFLEIPENDWHKLEDEEISIDDYIDGAEWYFGYYWGGGSMVTGGYFTPLEKEPGIHDVALIQRVMKAISYEGYRESSGYGLDEEKEKEWKFVQETYLKDPRRAFFKSVSTMINENYGYYLHGMYSSDLIGKDEIVLYSNGYERTFQLWIGDELVREMLYNQDSFTENISSMKLFVAKRYSERKRIPISNSSDFESALIDLGIIQEWNEYEENMRRYEEEEKKRKEEASTSNDPTDGVDKNLIQRILEFFRR